MNGRIPGVRLHRFKVIKDVRGNLVAGEFKKNIGFSPKRYFMVFGVPSVRQRGQHAHKKCHQFLVCVKGSMRVRLSDGKREQTVRLNRLNVGVHVPPMTWCTHFNYQPGTILLVFASHHYEASDYIRDFGEFFQLRKKYQRVGTKKTKPSHSSARR